MRVTALENFKGGKPSRMVCQSSDYAGDSSSSLTSTILGVVGSSASAVALSLGNSRGSGTQGQVPMYSRPVVQPSPMKSSSLFLFAALAVVGVIAYKKL